MPIPTDKIIDVLFFAIEKYPEMRATWQRIAKAEGVSDQQWNEGLAKLEKDTGSRFANRRAALNGALYGATHVTEPDHDLLQLGDTIVRVLQVAPAAELFYVFRQNDLIPDGGEIIFTKG